MTDLFEVKPENNYLIFHPEYSKVAEDTITVAIIGGYHYDFLGRQKLPSFTVDGIHQYLGGCAKKIPIRRRLEFLNSKGWLLKSKLSPVEAKNIVCQKQPQNFTFGTIKCEWCSAKTLVLDKHHYPVLKSEGGKEIVKVCPNCHQEFHQLLRVTSYNPSEKLISFFKELGI
jgi:hypothetical protein